MNTLTIALTSQLIPRFPPFSPLAWRTIRPFVSGSDAESVLLHAERLLRPSDTAQAQARVAAIPEFESEIGRLAKLGVFPLTEFDDHYPRRWSVRLADRTPASLFYSGNAELLNAPTIAIVGSREVDEEGKLFAEACAAVAVAENYSVVSGGARGVDLIAMRSARDSGGGSIGVLADPLLRAAQIAQSEGAFDFGRCCLCSPYAPDVGFSVGNAMARNKLVYAHAEAAIVVASTEGRGGTWAGATEAIESRLCPIFIRNVPDAGSGNAALIGRGAYPLSAPEELPHALERIEPAQGSLFQVVEP